MRDQQAQTRVAGNPLMKGMPVHNTNNGNSAKPLTPNLSPAFRQTKTPLTPKVHGSSNASPTVAAKKGFHTDSATRKRTDDGLSTPTFNNNITPRSAARKSRIGTESPSTPDGANVIRSPWPRSMVERDGPKEVSAGLAISSVCLRNSASPPPGSTSSGTRGLRLVGSVDGSAGVGLATQFFHADDARSAVSAHGAGERPKSGARAAAFFYANEAAPTHHDKERPVSRDITKQDGGNKFFYADEHLTRPLSVKPGPVGKPMSPSNVSSRFPSPEVQKNGRPAERPPSPLKEFSYTSAPPTLSSPRSRHVTSPGNAKRQESPVPSSPQQEYDTQRPTLSSTTSAIRKPAHQKSASASSAQTTRISQTTTPDAMPIRRPMDFISPKEVPTRQLSRPMTSPNSPELSTSNATSSVSTDTALSSLTLDSGQAMAHASPLQSPTKSGSRPQPPAEQLQKMNELAANARRERKVLDLEISNSSLLAINKTLEREMRKQSAELRRFRRLSRSGRFSIATGSLRSLSGESKLSVLAEKDDELGDLSDLGEMSDQDSEYSECSEDDMDSSFDDESSAVLSPTSRADYDARHRAKDEKRLMLDLSKHQQLLIDSQKMSQSIKRCLGWTEELIREGNRALAYHVKVSDVELGGRVLSRDDEEEGIGAAGDIVESSKGLLSPSLTMNMPDGGKLWANAVSQLDSDPDPMIVDRLEVLQPG